MKGERRDKIKNNMVRYTLRELESLSKNRDGSLSKEQVRGIKRYLKSAEARKRRAIGRKRIESRKRSSRLFIPRFRF